MKTIEMLNRKKARRTSAIICLHSSASSSKQWQSLANELSDKYRVVSADLAGYGKNQMPAIESKFSLDMEVELLKPVMETADEPIHLVGHSYGGAVAFAAALKYPQYFKSLTVYEPVLFNLLLADSGSDRAAREIHRVYSQINSLMMAGCPGMAGRIFINYWMQESSWDFMPDWQRAAIMSKMPKVLLDFEALFSSGITLSNLKQIDIPILYLRGRKSPLSTRRIAELISGAMPNARLEILEGLGHLAPITHPSRVNAMISEFIEKNDHLEKFPQKANRRGLMSSLIKTFPNRWNVGETGFMVMA